MSQPLQLQSLRVRRQLLPGGSHVLASIDRGSTLTKIAYATEDDAQHYQLHFALFTNKNFEEALQHLLKQRAVADGGKGAAIRVTGVGASVLGDKIAEVLRLSPTFIDEVASQFAGLNFLLRNFADAAICHPAPRTREFKIRRNEMHQKFIDQQNARLLAEGGEAAGADEKFPCLFAIHGSSAGIALVRKDGTIEAKHRHLLAGKSFVGAAQLLLGTCDFDAVMQLAAAGNRGNVDTQIRDVLADNPDSPYGNFPQSLGIFSFGKSVDFDIPLGDMKREDVAHSLVSSFAVNFFAAVSFVAKFEKVKNIYFGGNFYRHEIARSETAEAAMLHGVYDSLNLRFLRSGHTGAIGALVTSQEQAKQILTSMRLEV